MQIDCSTLLLLLLGFGCATPQSEELSLRSGDMSGHTELRSTASEVCFPGAQGTDDLCYPAHVPESDLYGYDYPDTKDPFYPTPTRFLDLHELPSKEFISPDFSVREMAAAWKGRWGVIQPRVVEHLQDIRDRMGPLVILSGYRSPAYNEKVGGAPMSRHLYGDGFDLVTEQGSLNDLANACWSAGAAYVVVYRGHVHCDWRWDPMDHAYLGDQASGSPERIADFDPLVENCGEPFLSVD